MADLAETVSDTRLVCVADREGDLRALMDAAARRGYPADWLVRAKHDRNTADGDKLWTRLARSEALGAVEFTLPAALDRSARAVRQTLCRESVTLPARNGAPTVTVTVTAILAREERPPSGQKAVEWRLVDQPGGRYAQSGGATRCWYRRRWLAEIFSESGNPAAGSKPCNWAHWIGWSGLCPLT